MSVTLSLEAQPRDSAKNKGTGSKVARSLRAKGRIPAIIYGHKQANSPVSLNRDDVWRMIKMQSHLAELTVGGTKETVLVKNLQWDYLGREIIHVDFARVDLEETIDTMVKLEAKGTAKGTSEGGVLEWLTHDVKVHCRAVAIPDSIRVDVSNLGVGQGIHGRDLILPEGVALTNKADIDALLLHVVFKTIVEADTKKATESQPEVIKKEKKKDDKPAK